jgi:nucleoside-diphosphate-sugar epimerase
VAENPDGLNVLVTGANGFLGRHLITRLSQHNAKIYAVSRKPPLSAGGVRWVQGDLTNGDWLSELVRSIRPDVIYQLASASQGGQDSQFVLPTFENDLRSTVNTLLAAKACGCARVILAASLEEPVLDGRPITISSPYAAAKASCTYYGLMFHQLYGVPVTMLRLFMTYGPGQKAYKLIPYTILSMLKGQSPRLSSGVRPVDWVYVQDVITAFIAAAVRPEAVGQIIDIGSGSLVPVREVIQEIHRLIPQSPAPLLGALPDRTAETVRCAETEAAARILAWKATTPLSKGLCQTIQWCREQMHRTSC